MPEKKIYTKNHTVRIGNDFFEEFEAINKERLSLGLRKISMRKFTNLLRQHNSWPTIRADLIEIKLGEKENE